VEIGTIFDHPAGLMPKTGKEVKIFFRRRRKRGKEAAIQIFDLW
jgi:hypothetical protein